MNDEASFLRGLHFGGVCSLSYLARNVKVYLVLGGASRKHRTRYGFDFVFLPAVGHKKHTNESYESYSAYKDISGIE